MQISVKLTGLQWISYPFQMLCVYAQGMETPRCFGLFPGVLGGNEKIMLGIESGIQPALLHLLAASDLELLLFLQ